MMFARPLTWGEWILWCLAEEPARIFDPAERDRFIAEYWARNPRLEARQWRRDL